MKNKKAAVMIKGISLVLLTGVFGIMGQVC